MPDNPRDPWIRTTEPLLWLNGAGHEIYSDTRYYFDSRKRTDRPHITLQLTLDGQGFFQDRRGRTPLPTGWAFMSVIPGPFEYGYDPLSQQPYELTFISLDGPVAMRWHKRITRSFGQLLNLTGNDRIAPLMLSIASARVAGNLPDRYLLSAQLYQMLMEIYSSLTRARLSTSPRVTQAMKLIATHADDAAFGISQLAGEMDCSREHLTRLFRAATGVSPSDYLTQQRLRRAATALRSSDAKLETIARRHGFTSANYFCRTFKEHVGTTPARFRREPWLMVP